MYLHSLKCPVAMRGAITVLACGLAVLLGDAATAAAAPGDSAALSAPPDPGAAGMTQLDRLPVLDPRAQALGASSHARDGSNFDFTGLVRRDAEGRYVLMEASGPGVVTRLWMTGPVTQGNGDPAVFGRIQFFIDGETSPRIDVPAAELFGGGLRAFPAPLCHDYRVSSGGDYCDVRIPFAKSVKVVTTGPSAYYDVGYETYPRGTAIHSYRPRDRAALRSLAEAASTWERAGRDPRILPPGRTDAGTTRVPAGGTAKLVRIRGSGAIRAIRIALDRHDDATLRAVRLRARWDGADRPAVDAPLADLFLTGAGEREPAAGLLAGYSPRRHQGYLYFPMPFRHGASVRLLNPTDAAVTARWSVQRTTRRYGSVGHATGRFHATFNREPATELGRDYTMLAARGAGKVVGVSFTERGDYPAGLPTFLEGDERVYVDGSRTPAIYGTGTEDFFSGAYYYTSMFSLPDHGATALEQLGPNLAQAAQYRLMLADPWQFRRGIRLGIEHGGGDGQQTAARSVVFWYGTGRSRLRRTGSVEVGGSGYAGAGSKVTLTSFFEGDRDGNISKPPDYIVPGALPPPVGTDPQGESVTATGLLHPVGTRIRFTVRLDPSNRGAVLRRLLDQGVFGQRAAVRVDGRPAGTWFTPGSNEIKRWAESDFALPGRLTHGKSRVRVELRVLAPADPPPGATIGWSDFRYTAFSLTPP